MIRLAAILLLAASVARAADCPTQFQLEARVQDRILSVRPTGLDTNGNSVDPRIFGKIGQCENWAVTLTLMGLGSLEPRDLITPRSALRIASETCDSVYTTDRWQNTWIVDLETSCWETRFAKNLLRSFTTHEWVSVLASKSGAESIGEAMTTNAATPTNTVLVSANRYMRCGNSNVLTAIQFMGTVSNKRPEPTAGTTIEYGEDSTRRGILRTATLISEPKLSWTASGAVYGAPVFILGNRILTTVANGNLDTDDVTTIVCYGEDGSLFWSRKLPAESPRVLTESMIYGGSGLLVYAGRWGATESGALNEGPIYALNLTDGSIAWTSDSNVHFGLSPFYSPILILENGDIIAGSNIISTMWKFSHTNGTALWTRAGLPGLRGTQLACDPTEAVVWWQDGSYLYGLNVADGTTRLGNDLSGQPGTHHFILWLDDIPITCDGSRVYVRSSFNDLHQFKYDIGADPLIFESSYEVDLYSPIYLDRQSNMAVVASDSKIQIWDISGNPLRTLFGNPRGTVQIQTDTKNCYLTTVRYNFEATTAYLDPASGLTWNINIGNGRYSTIAVSNSGNVYINSNGTLRKYVESKQPNNGI